MRLLEFMDEVNEVVQEDKEAERERSKGKKKKGRKA